MHRRFLIKRGVGSVAVFFFFLFLSAQKPKPKPAEEQYPFAFARVFNRDADPRISLSEWVQALNWAFMVCDNGDGKLLFREMDRCEAKIRSMDTNNDGAISITEWKDSSASFSFWDANKNKLLTLASEVNIVFTPLLSYLKKNWNKLDKDASGSLSSGEYQNWVLAQFSALDRNGDKHLSETDGTWPAAPPSPPKAKKPGKK
ncbi:MAG: hypothetical protein V2G48_06105 [bacterium JZ-2024 1]